MKKTNEQILEEIRQNPQNVSRGIAKQAERRFGGLKKARALLGLSTIDFTTGSTRANKCIAINKRGQEQEKMIYELLCKKFGKTFVHKEHTPLDDRRIRVDFLVYCKTGNFYIDVFYPETMQSMGGCLNNKIKKYVGNSMGQFPVIFLMTNDQIPEDRIEAFLKARKNAFGKQQTLMTLRKFKKYIQNMHANTIK